MTATSTTASTISSAPPPLYHGPGSALQGRYGVYGKAQAWYDYAGEQDRVPHGSIANGYVPDQKLNDGDYHDYNQFSGRVLDLYTMPTGTSTPAG